MAGPSGFQPQQRGNPFARNPSASPAPANGSAGGRPKSVLFSTPATPDHPAHFRSQSQTTNSATSGLVRSGSVSRANYDRSREGTPVSSTFAPSFINTEEMKRRSIDVVRGIEGENDFSGKRYVWLKDPQTAFVKGWIVEELGDGRILVQCDDGSVSICPGPDPRTYTHASARPTLHKLHIIHYTLLILEGWGLTAATRDRCRERRQGQPRQIR